MKAADREYAVNTVLLWALAYGLASWYGIALLIEWVVRVA